MHEEKGTLMTKTIELLKADKRSLFEISQKSAIKFYWLKKFSQGEFTNPSVNRVQALYEFLTEQQLTLQ